MSSRLSTSTALALLVLSALIFGSTPARAQQPARPYQGLFNGTGDKAKTHSTWVSFSFETADDRNEIGSNGDGGVPPRTYSDAVAEIHFERALRRFTVAASGSAAMRTDTASGNPSLLKDVVGVSIASTPKQRTGFRFSATRIDAPYTLLTLEGPTSLESANLVSAASDHFVTDRRIVIESATAGLTQRLGRRTAISADYDVRLTTGFIGQSDLTTERATARIERELTRTLGVNGGYSLQFGTYSRPTDATLNSREADAGLTYRPHAGHMQFAFGAGSAAVDEGVGTRQHLTGYARVDRGIGRAWSVRSEYRRAVEIAPGFVRPLVADSATVSLGGFLTRRIDVLGFGGVWFTQTATSGVAGYHSNRLGGRVRFALSRMFAIYGEYLHYEYRFDPLAEVPPSLANNFVRRGVRFGVVSRLPLFR